MIVSLSQLAWMFWRGKMAGWALRLFVSVRSLCRVKSGGHWSKSASHWLFLYVSLFIVALQRYHETYFTSWPMPPPEGLAHVSRGNSDALQCPGLASTPSLAVIHLAPPPKLSCHWPWPPAMFFFVFLVIIY